MKKILTLVFVLALSSTAFANQMNTGCGLGHMLLGDKGDTKLMQVLITCTNGTCTNQSIGITLDIGAFGCSPTQKWASNELFEFVSTNMDSLVRDVAAGHGDTITTLASMLNVEDVEAYGAMLQENFALIFPAADVEFAYVADAIHMVSNS